MRWRGWGQAATTAAGLLGRPLFQWAALLLLGPVAAWWGLRGALATDAPFEFTLDADHRVIDVALLQEPVGWAVTDAGRKVPLYAVDRKVRPEAVATKEEEAYLGRRHLLLAVIRTAEPSLETNCHGWIFTGGRAWVLDDAVDPILHDNGYQPTTTPQPGDLAVFRQADGVPAHTCLVRSVNDDGAVVLESKWGQLGRFLHAPDQHPYACLTRFYYHSARRGHLLKMSDQTAAN